MSLKKLKTKLLFISLIILVIFRFLATRQIYVNGQKIRVTAKVLQEPIKYTWSQSLTLAGLKVYLPLFPEIQYGERVVIEGVVQDKKLTNAKLVTLEENKGFLYQFRQKIIEFYQKVLPESHASLLAGMVLGSKSGIPGDFWQALKKTGTAHVIVASGMNVSIVAGFLVGFMALFLPRRKTIPFVILGISLYSILAGFDAPIIRAGIMGTVAFLAQETGRLVSAWKALNFSALVMLLVKPEWLTDIGFILSFVATAALLLFEKPIRRRLLRVPEVLREGFSTSLAAQIGVSPILFVTFGQFNILSPLINALVLWTVPLITIIGMAGGIAGLVIPSLGRLILYLVYPLSWWFVTVIQIFNF